jgi:asparagine synthase (glutamine-hydrolysing)
MCGIACVISPQPRAEREEIIEKVLAGISHRGRDGAGVISVDLADQNVGVTLGHRRLSVIDLETRANQPFTSQCGKIIVSFNGEIYNYLKIRATLTAQGYHFVTESDTEVIVAGYVCFGPKIFDMLEGMFAIVLLSIAERAVYIARDFFGIKPLYYSLSPQRIIICSESKSISQVVHSRPSLEKLRTVLAFGYNVGFPSVFSDISKIPQGEVIKYDLATSTWTRSPISFKSCEDLEGPATRSVERLLTKSVIAQTVSDIGFGLFLSGGIDSGLIASILKRNGHTFPMFTAGNLEERGSDASRAKLLSDTLNVPIFNVDVKDSEIPGIMLNTYSSLTEPILDSALVYSSLLSKLASSEGVRVILSGAGGDELFFGYRRYSASNLSRVLFRTIPLGVRRLLSKLIDSQPLKNRLRFPSVDFAMQIAGSMSAMKDIPLAHLETSDFKAFDSNFCTSVKDQNKYDFDVYLPENILLGFDQTTMMHTVEGRVPYLDRPLYEFSRRLSPQDHMAGGRLKSILREIASSHLPPEYLAAPKQGFSGPVSTWVDGNMPFFIEYATKSLGELYAPVSGVSPDKAIKELNQYDLFNLTALQIWMNQN